MKTFKNEFQGEAQQAGFQTLEELNTALWAWIDVEYNRRNHSSTGEPPADRFAVGLPDKHRRIDDLQWFQALFLQRQRRTVSKYGVVKLCGNQYRTQAHHGTVIEVRYDPFDLHNVWQFENGRSVETLALHKLVSHCAQDIPEERGDKQAKVSDAAVGYFTVLRERQSQLRAQVNSPQYNKLKGEDH